MCLYGDSILLILLRDLLFPSVSCLSSKNFWKILSHYDFENCLFQPFLTSPSGPVPRQVLDLLLLLESWGFSVPDSFPKSLTLVGCQRIHSASFSLVLFGLISEGLLLPCPDIPAVFFSQCHVLALECFLFLLSLEILETHLFLHSFEVVLFSVLPGV